MLQVILSIAFGAKAENRPTELAMAYDIAFRKDVENRVGQIGLNWLINIDYEVFTTVDENILRNARRCVAIVLSPLCMLAACVVFVRDQDGAGEEGDAAKGSG